MWLWSTREKDLPAMTLLEDDGQATCSASGPPHRPNRAETIPLVDYIKSLLGLGERAQGEGPDRVGPGGLERQGAAIERRAVRAEKLDLVGKGEKVPFGTVGQAERPAGDVLDLDVDADDAVRAVDRFAEGQRDPLLPGPHGSPALQPERPPGGRERELAFDEVA